jgi:hypothetical protein
MRRIIAGPESRKGAADFDDLAVDRQDRAHHAEIDRERTPRPRSARFRGSKMPSHRMNSGTQAIDGIARSACTSGIEQLARQAPIAGDGAEQGAATTPRPKAANTRVSVAGYGG